MNKNTKAILVYSLLGWVWNFLLSILISWIILYVVSLKITHLHPTLIEQLYSYTFTVVFLLIAHIVWKKVSAQVEGGYKKIAWYSSLIVLVFMLIWSQFQEILYTLLTSFSFFVISLLSIRKYLTPEEKDALYDKVAEEKTVV